MATATQSLEREILEFTSVDRLFAAAAAAVAASADFVSVSQA